MKTNTAKIAASSRGAIPGASRKSKLSEIRRAAVRKRWGPQVVGRSRQIRCGEAEAEALRAYAEREGMPISVAASRAIRRYLEEVGDGVR